MERGKKTCLCWGMTVFLIFLAVWIAGCKQDEGDSNEFTPGTYDRSVTVDGLKRTFRLYVPGGYTAEASLSLVIVLHGGGGTGPEIEKLSGFSELAERENFFVAYPDGYVDNHWADGRGTTQPEQQGVNDVKFIGALVDEISMLVKVDSKRVFLCGFSNGSMMGNRLACEISQKLAAVGLISGQLAENLKNQIPATAVGFIYFHGTDDPVVPYAGGTVLGPNGGQVISVNELIAFWINVNQTSAVPQNTILPDKDPSDGTRVLHQAYLNGRDGTEVHLYRVENGGHTWPGHGTTGMVTRDIDATRLMWDFFKTQHK